MSEKKRILVMAGGTGGHIVPALTMAESLREKGYEIIWLGTPNSMEAQWVREHRFPLEIINIQKLRGKGRLAWFLAPYRLACAVFRSIRIIRRLKPDVVIGMGGYVAAPGGIAAWLLRCPLLIHEQNATPGLTNRLLSRLARRVMTAFPQTFDTHSKVHLTGNPVRPELVTLPPPDKRPLLHGRPLQVLVLGGSLGAEILNKVLPEALGHFALKDRPRVWHQTGRHRQQATKQAYAEHNIDAKIQVFIQDMLGAYEWADVVVARAGAMTIAEITAVGMASILIPYPYAADDHQTRNAHFLSDKQAAILLPQKRLTSAVLHEQLQQFYQHPGQLREMAGKAHAQAKLDATEEVVRHCEEVCE